MIDCVIEDREMIIQAVLDGILGVEHITDDELQLLEENLFDEVAELYSLFDMSYTEH